VYDGRVTDVLTGWITKFLLYDVAEAIDLTHVRQLFGVDSQTGPSVRPRLSPYVEYRHLPVSIDGVSAGVPDIEGFQVRLKAFDYGVISVALRQPVPDSWNRLLADIPRLYDDAGLADAGERARRTLMDCIAPALIRPRADSLSEDYLVVTVTRVADAATATQVLTVHGGDIAQLLRGESDKLSDQEREEILRHRISYFATESCPRGMGHSCSIRRPAQRT